MLQCFNTVRLFQAKFTINSLPHAQVEVTHPNGPPLEHCCSQGGLAHPQPGLAGMVASQHLLY